MPHAVLEYKDFQGKTSYEVLNEEAYTRRQVEVRDESRLIRTAVTEARRDWRRKYQNKRDRDRDNGRGGRSSVTSTRSVSFPTLRIGSSSLRRKGVFPDLEAATAAADALRAKDEAAAERSLKRFSFNSSESGSDGAEEEAIGMIRDELDRLVKDAANAREEGKSTGLRLSGGDSGSVHGIGESSSGGLGQRSTGLGLRNGKITRLGE